MIRKLVLLAVTAMAALAVSATTASAAVVHNPGMFQATGDQLSLIAHFPGIGEFVQDRCTNDWELNVAGNGHVDIHNVEIDPPGTGPCTTLEDCDGEGWEGQITSQHTVHVDFCLEGAGTGADIGGEATCSVSDGWLEVHCESSLVTEPFGVTTPPFPAGTTLEIEGELDLDEALSIEE